MMEIGIYNKLSKDEFIRGRRRRDRMVVGFGGGNGSTCRKPLTCRKSLKNFIT
jgi:hypothetical protein